MTPAVTLAPVFRWTDPAITFEEPEPPATTICPACHGTGRVDRMTSADGVCAECSGSGLSTTESI